MGLFLAKQNKIGLYVQNKDTKQWREAEPTEIRDLQSELRRTLFIPVQITRPHIGFMRLFKKGEMVFHLKEINDRRNNKGARCTIIGKIDIIKRLTSILAENPYGQSSTRFFSRFLDADAILRPALCVVLELLTRYYNDNATSLGKKVWFFDVEKALANKVVDLKTSGV